jgi:hypothetical protein
VKARYDHVRASVSMATRAGVQQVRTAGAPDATENRTLDGRPRGAGRRPCRFSSLDGGSRGRMCILRRSEQILD